MSGFKDIVKNGWHPEKSGTSIKGSVTSLVGRNKSSPSQSNSNHVSRPLSDLKDPAQFAPPPRRTGSGLAPPAPPVSEKRKVITSPSKYMDPRAAQSEPSPPPPQNDGSRRSTSGPSTRDLPKPPIRRDGANAAAPPSYTEATTRTITTKALPPSLPPRLPPRAAADSSSSLNTGAVSRLGAAGIQVPALGIGGGGSSSSPASQRATTLASSPGGWGSQVNELQGRFGSKRTSSTTQEPSEQGGTTWAQKQAAVRTASDFHKNPSSVSLSDATSAAATANNFRRRHGDQIASAAQTANTMNQKYQLAGRAKTTFAEPSSAAKTSPPRLPGPGQMYTGADTSGTAKISATGSEIANKKKPPPPPTKKKPQLLTGNAGDSFSTILEHEEPPPVPISTRPTF